MTKLLAFLAATILLVAWMMIRAEMEDEERNNER